MVLSYIQDKMCSCTFHFLSPRGRKAFIIINTTVARKPYSPPWRELHKIKLSFTPVFLGLEDEVSKGDAWSLDTSAHALKEANFRENVYYDKTGIDFQMFVS